jgi:pyruvate,water dikinase
MDNRIDLLLKDLRERTKELNCLYNIEELLQDTDDSLEKMFGKIIQIIPSGWQYPEVCQVCIEFEGQVFQSSEYKKTSIVQSAEIVIQGLPVGRLHVAYTGNVPTTMGSYFLKEEEKLISAIADRLGHTILHKQMKYILNEWEDIKEKLSKEQRGKWRAIVDTLRLSDKKLFIYISRRMLQYLCWHGVSEADGLMQEFGTIKKLQSENGDYDENRPLRKQALDHLVNLSDEIFNIASKNLDEDQVLSCIQKWLQEDKSRFLVKAIENPSSTLSDLINTITKYHFMESEAIVISPSIEKGLRVALSRRFLSDDLDFIHVAKNYIGIADYYDLSQRMIFPEESRGKLGGKSAGLILASQIIKSSDRNTDLFENLRVPKTWYITSDGLMNFLHYNNLEEVIEQKFKDFDEIASEYPNIIQIFKNSYFHSEIIKGLSNALDNFGESPIIVRSSSLLEDRIGAAFSGKYKSLFLANQGSKEERLEALMDAIAEVYASTFGPDPIIYRSERGLLDYHEEMGIMIQEVVGTRVGDYYFPVFSGVAFSKNEFRWSPRIDREDGLIRAVPGLGTRAVDRLSDDYCILIAPGKPELRVNVTPDEILRYSTKKMDVINLKKNTFETIDISKLIKSHGSEIPHIHNILSIYQEDHIQMPTSTFGIRFEEDTLAVTFEGLIQRTPMIKQIRALLEILQEKFGMPADIEFAFDGINLYLLQCRAQSYSKDILPSPIPKNIPKEKIIFNANRYVSNGFVPDISHIVYVDPLAYNQLSNPSKLNNVGRAIGKLNMILPKSKFILMGPGRWGSRGDIKLGVNVTYSDINNTAILIEIARKKGNYIPELSFGTHFFQDLVESSIRYLPLYPDDGDVIFNEEFLLRTRSIFSELLPDFSRLSDTIRVIDVSKNTDSSVLCVLMNAELGEAVAYLKDPG